MSHSFENNSAGSQFFIMHKDNTYLDGNYAAFGRVLGGMNELDRIANTAVDKLDRPRTDQTIRTIYVETFGREYPFTKLTPEAAK